ncbi:putative CXXCH cytochrome family protein [Rhizobium mesoamericanum]|uniref:tetratricopeptide repeat protein n=1 Tax=Rhizobium mesoamericanum TaxID=1079800 RepID=UPI002781BD14|nr:tetratricopeptide repeat protein [Rhizobium mesoamericanum]MDQ0561570.1 putative CXXCH cytochrome family protein [Rhizobium mesoamericanum]
MPYTTLPIFDQEAPTVEDAMVLKEHKRSGDTLITVEVLDSSIEKADGGHPPLESSKLRQRNIRCEMPLWGAQALRNRRSRRKLSGSTTRSTATSPSEAERPHPPAFSTHIRGYIAVAAAALIVIVGGFLYGLETSDRPQSTLPVLPTTFVGSESCAGCHPAETKLWRTSQHKRAMDHATDKTVLGDFNNASLDHFGVHSRFFRKDEKFMVETDGPDGKLAAFEVKYTFGVEPLQQYLVEFSDGRIQALPLAWDSRPKAKGGQRWFHLYPDEPIGHGDILHWTRLNQNWNFMCAECHSTGVHKNYDADKDRFATSWAEISVGCEACHGKGSRHVAWASAQQSWWPFKGREDPEKGLVVRFDERKGVSWTTNPATGLPTRSLPPSAVRKEVETCGLCHARRSQFSEDWVPGSPLSDTHHVSVLDRSLFHADGQMRDREETYNYAPFKQSKMFAKGVTCTDCHDPHSATLRAPEDGVCAQCHMPERYETAAHRHHDEARAPLACASCHMPARTYMVIDQRHDHSFRIPRPDLSIKLGHPNACNDCHRDKSAEWAAAAVEGWFGPNRKGFQNYGEAFHAAWTEQVGAERPLAMVARDPAASSFVHASVLTELNAYLSAADVELARSGLADRDPMVRIGALDMLEGAPADQLWPILSPLLSDPVRGVRLRTVSMLASVPTASQPAADRHQFDQAAAEFVAAQRLNADRPEGRSTLANFLARRGMAAEAEVEFRAALHLSPEFAPAAVNLADLYRALGRDFDGEQVLRTGLQASPEDAGLRYALGLTLVRLGRSEDAFEELRQANKLSPDQAQYAYAYALALHSVGRTDEAIALLEKSLVRHPSDRGALLALATLNRDTRNFDAALGYAERLLSLVPSDPGILRLVEDLRRLVHPVR